VGSAALDREMEIATGVLLTGVREDGVWGVKEGRWTQSLDMALALAERVLGEKASVWQIVRFFGRHSVQFGDHLALPSGEGATAPLAACIAILKTKEAPQ